MNMKKIKEFVKEYKMEIIGGCMIVAGCVGGVALYNKRKYMMPNDIYERFKNSPDEDMKLLGMVCELWDKAAVGADSAIPAIGEDLINTVGENFVVTDSDGTKMMITGAILFGNKVET